MDFGIVHKEHEVPTGHPSRDDYLEMGFELTGDQVTRIINHMSSIILPLKSIIITSL